MKKYIMIFVAVALVLIVVLILISNLPRGMNDSGLNQSQSSGEIDYLSIEQSLLPAVRVKCFDSAYSFPFNRINPAIKEHLLYYLSNNNSDSYTTFLSLMLLGYVAGEEDFTFVDGFIQSSIKKANTRNSKARVAMGFQNFGLGSGCLIGIMLKKEIKGTRELLNKYSDLSIWISECKDEKSKKEALNAYEAFLVQVYQYSINSDVFRILKNRYSKGRTLLSEDIELLEKREIDMYSKSIKPVSISEKDLQKKLNKALEEDFNLIQPILNKLTSEQWRKKLEQDRDKSTKSKPAPAEMKTVSAMEDDPLVRLALFEAKTAYDKVSKLVLDGNFKDIENLIADNGKAIPAEKVKADRQGMLKALEKVKQILKDVDQAGLHVFNEIRVGVTLEGYQDSTGTTIMEAKFEDFPDDLKSTEEVGKSKMKGAVVTFVIQDSSEIFKTYVPRTFDNTTKANNGDLKVFMIYHDGKWLWNPFGW